MSKKKHETAPFETDETNIQTIEDDGEIPEIQEEEDFFVELVSRLPKLEKHSEMEGRAFHPLRMWQGRIKGDDQLFIEFVYYGSENPEKLTTAFRMTDSRKTLLEKFENALAMWKQNPKNKNPESDALPLSKRFLFRTKKVQQSNNPALTFIQIHQLDQDEIPLAGNYGAV